MKKTKLNPYMIKIKVNGQDVPLYNALLHICGFHLQHKFDVREYNEYAVELETNSAGKVERSNYGAYNTGFMLHILQLVQAVRGFGMDNVHSPLKPEQVDWLGQFTGENKVKVALGMLGRCWYHPNYVCQNFSLEQVCEAYALHAHDRRVLMQEWLVMMSMKKLVA